MRPPKTTWYLGGIADVKMPIYVDRIYNAINLIINILISMCIIEFIGFKLLFAMNMLITLSHRLENQRRKKIIDRT